MTHGRGSKKCDSAPKNVVFYSWITFFMHTLLLQDLLMDMQSVGEIWQIESKYKQCYWLLVTCCFWQIESKLTATDCWSHPRNYVVIVGRRVTRGGSKLANSLGLTPNNNMNFRLARDQIVLHETAANLWASRRKANDFLAVFSSFEPVSLSV